MYPDTIITQLCNWVFHGLCYSLTVFDMPTWPSRNHIIIVPKWGIPNVNDDLAEVNWLGPPNVTRLIPQQERPWVRCYTTPCNSWYWMSWWIFA